MRSTTPNHLPVPPENKAVWALVSAKATRKATRCAVSDPLHQGHELSFACQECVLQREIRSPRLKDLWTYTVAQLVGELRRRPSQGVRGTGTGHVRGDKTSDGRPTHTVNHICSQNEAFLGQVVVCIITVVTPLLRAALKALSSVFRTSILQNHAQSSIIRHRYNAFID